MFCTDKTKNQHLIASVINLIASVINLILFAKENKDYFIIKQQFKHLLQHEFMQYEKKTINFL